MTQKEFIESKDNEIYLRIYNVFKTMQQLSGYDEKQYDEKINLILADVSTALKEIVIEHFRNIGPMSYGDRSKLTERGNGWEDCCDQITSRHNKFLS